jgi:hypothetical protein
MSLFRKPEEVKSGLKFLIYGATGTGKTWFALSFPEIIGVDTEDGWARYIQKPIGKNIKGILTSSSASDLEEALDEIDEELVGTFKTFALDSYTKIYENQQFALQSLAEKRQRRKGGDIEDVGMSVRDWGKLKLNTKRIQATQLMLASKGVNIVNIAQEADIKEKKGDQFVVVGHKPDLSKGVEFDYDVVLRFITEEDKKNKKVSYKAEVLKDRTGTFKKYDVVESPIFDMWSDTYKETMSAKESVVNFNNDINKDINKEATESASTTEIVDEIKSFLKSANAEQKAKIVKAMKTMELNVKDLASNDIEKLKEILDLTQTL